MSNQDERWDLVAAAIASRMEELRLTKAELSRRAQVSEPTITGYLNGQPIRRTDKLWALCDALGWAPESIDLIQTGRAPLPVEQVERRRYSFSKEEVDAFADRMHRLEQRLDQLEAVLTPVLDRWEAEARPTPVRDEP